MAKTGKDTWKVYVKSAAPTCTGILAEILSYQELYSPEDITAAIKKCLEIGSFHKNSVKRFLEQRKVAPLTPVDGQLKLNLPLVTIKRDLSCYAFKGSEVGAVP